MKVLILSSVRSDDERSGYYSVQTNRCRSCLVAQSVFGMRTAHFTSRKRLMTNSMCFFLFLPSSSVLSPSFFPSPRMLGLSHPPEPYPKFTPSLKMKVCLYYPFSFSVGVCIAHLFEVSHQMGSSLSTTERQQSFQGSTTSLGSLLC